MEYLSTCPACGERELSAFLECKDYTVSKETFKIAQCVACEFRFTNPRPNQNDIVKYYQSEDYISHSNTKVGLISRLYQIIRNYTIAKKLSIVERYVSRGTLLDIGCGTGEFLNYCNNNGWVAAGIEPGTDARKYATEVYGLNVQSEAFINEVANASYDAVTMWHVLEHVHELNERVQDLKRIVKDDGVIIIAVPNHTSYDAKHYKEFWAAYDLPRHLYHFNPKTIIALFEKHGLKKVSVLPMKFDSYYVSMLSEKYKSGMINYLKALVNGLLSNLKATFKSDNSFSSQIYIFKKNLN